MSICWKPNWKKGEIIRQVLTGKPYLVIHIYSLGINETATCAIDLEAKEDPQSLKVITQGNYDKYVRDIEMEPVNNGESVKWVYKELKL